MMWSLCTAHFHLKELSSPMYSRRELAKDYFKGEKQKIRRICPVCLNMISNGETDEDVEHYFPKSGILVCACIRITCILLFCLQKPVKGKKKVL